MHTELFTSLTKKQIIEGKKAQVRELLYMDFLKRYDTIFRKPPDIARCEKVYEQIKNIKF